ncbi:hypothetical protein [Amycolatopsis sp. w19]|uniref:hypothetical protein n=1 Tax=Amycolatopsis sp. w19 TaxID=3448134 RepID=UPI003F19EE6F
MQTSRRLDDPARHTIQIWRVCRPSYGFDVIWFAGHVLKAPLDPWEQVAVIRLGELLPDNATPRFRTVLIIVGG